MQTKANTQRKSIFEGTNVKVRQIDLSSTASRALKVNSEYSRIYRQITEDEIRELPAGILIYPPYRGIYRTISGAANLDHIQLIHYPQPILGGMSTAEFLGKVKEGAVNKDHPIYSYKEYINDNYLEMCSNFPYAAQVAYDLYTTGELSNKTHELKKIIADRYSNIVKSIEESKI